MPLGKIQETGIATIPRQRAPRAAKLHVDRWRKGRCLRVYLLPSAVTPDRMIRGGCLPEERPIRQVAGTRLAIIGAGPQT